MENTDKQEILEAIAGLADHMDDRFEAVDRRFDVVDKRFDRLEDRVGAIEIKMPQLVTKDYLDKKLGELRGDTVIMIRRALSPSA